MYLFFILSFGQFALATKSLLAGIDRLLFWCLVKDTSRDLYCNLMSILNRYLDNYMSTVTRFAGKNG